MSTAPEPVDVGIRDEMIRLGQFLKLANLVDDGAQAKAVVAAGGAEVNGEVELRRGRQLHAGDVVAVGEQRVRLVQGEVADNLPW